MHKRIRDLSKIFLFGVTIVTCSAIGSVSDAGDAPAWGEGDLVPMLAQVVGQPPATLTFDQAVGDPLLSADLGDPFGPWVATAAIDPMSEQRILNERLASRESAAKTPNRERRATTRDADRPLGARLASAIAKALGSDPAVEKEAEPNWHLARFDAASVLGKLRTTLFGRVPEQTTTAAQGQKPAPAQEEVTLARVIAEPAEVRPLRRVSLTLGTDDPGARSNLYKLSSEPKPRAAVLRQPAPQTVAPQRQRLRPFDAAALGIRVAPGSSADSLARMLGDVSKRPPAALGFGPALTGSQRTIPFERLLKVNQGLFSRD